jgi:hypothetical protein
MWLCVNKIFAPEKAKGNKNRAIYLNVTNIPRI